MRGSRRVGEGEQEGGEGEQEGTGGGAGGEGKGKEVVLTIPVKPESTRRMAGHVGAGGL